MSHIWLAGMMGTGKTTVGAIVSERLERPLLDTDTMVMEASGRTVTELFEASEAEFRRLERAAVASAARHSPSVISTGGGAVVDEDNVAVMRTTGTIVVLTADVATIAARLVGQEIDRPLAGSERDLERLAAARARAYEAAADHTVNTTDRDPGDVAEEVMACVAT